MSDEWESVSTGTGSFIGWGNDPGQVILGEVVSYGEFDGTTQKGDRCPEVTVRLEEPGKSINKLGVVTPHEAGALVTVTGNKKNLERGLKNANPSPGDKIRIELEKLTPSGEGIAKIYDIKIKRNSPQAPRQAAPAYVPPSTPSFGGGFGSEAPF